MLKSQVNVPTHVIEEPVFPLMARSDVYDMVVLFTSKIMGTVVATGERSDYKIGDTKLEHRFHGLKKNFWEVLPVGSSVTIKVKEDGKASKDYDDPYR